MDRWLEPQVRAAPPAAPEPVSAETLDKLRALGYVGTAPVSALAAADLPDPKDKVRDAEALKEAILLRASGAHQKAVARFREVLADNPRMVDGWEMLASSLRELGRTDEAVAALDRAVAAEPTHGGAHLALARLHALEGRLDRAVQHAEVAAAANPGHAFELLAQIAMDRGDHARARELARRSLEADDRREMSHFILGALAQKEGRCEDALRSFGRAEAALRLSRHTVVRNLHANMGDCLARLGRLAEAEKQFQAEIETIPYTREGRVGLATLYRSQGRDEEARAVLGGLVSAERAPTAEHYWTVVRTLSVLGDLEAAGQWAARARARFPSDPRFRASR
jgi:tetratricopeptide (TPR) repeat protein